MTGESAGQVWSSEIHKSRAPTLSHQGEGHTTGSEKRERPVGPAESKTLSMRGHSMRGNRETPSASVGNLTRRIGQERPVVVILTRTPAGSQTSA